MIQGWGVRLYRPSIFFLSIQGCNLGAGVGDSSMYFLKIIRRTSWAKLLSTDSEAKYRVLAMVYNFTSTVLYSI